MGEEEMIEVHGGSRRSARKRTSIKVPKKRMIKQIEVSIGKKEKKSFCI